MKRPIDPVMAEHVKTAVNAVCLSDKHTHVSEVFQSLMEEFGGPNEFARLVKRTFNDERGGSLMQQRILAMIVQLAVYDTKIRGEKEVDISGLEDGDLEREARLLMEELGMTSA